MSYYGGEGESACTCREWAKEEGPSVRRRMQCAHHLFRDSEVARHKGIKYDAAWVALRMRREQEKKR